MAKWGEGDPRWLVEERPDATNVNNWHWSEKNASDWSKDKLKELLVGLKIDGEEATCEIIEMTKCNGEATVNNRKAKIIVFYEWEVTLKWKGSLKDEEMSGAFEILNLSEEHEMKDVDINIGCDAGGDASGTMKEFLRIQGVECVKKELEKYVKSLVEEFSKGLLLPTKDLVQPVIQLKQQTGQRKDKVLDIVVPTKPAVETTETNELHTTEIFKCRAEDLYQTLTVKDFIQAFTRSNCIVESKVGGKFELYDGNVQGCYTELVPNELVRQQWRLKSWPDGHFSDVKIEIKETPDSTEVVVHQTGIPKEELDNTRNGWKRYYWQSIKRVFGFGSTLL